MNEFVVVKFLLGVDDSGLVFGNRFSFRLV